MEFMWRSFMTAARLVSLDGLLSEATRHHPCPTDHHSGPTHGRTHTHDSAPVLVGNHIGAPSKSYNRMSHESVQTVPDPVFKNKMPLFDGTVAPTGLSKPQTLSGFLGKQPLQYSGAYFSYEPRGKEGAGFASPWNNSKTSPLHDRSPVSHLTGMEGQNHVIYRQDSTSSEEGHSHSSSMRHTPVKQGFMVYTRSPEISSPTVATSVTIRKQKTGAENSSSPSQSSVYLAIPKPVYGHNPCCNELGCMIGQRYSLEHVSPRMPNTIYEHDWMQRAAHYTEKAPIQRKEALLQQRGLQYECGAEQIKRMTVEAYSPSSARTLPSVIEPNYNSYPCTPTRALYGSLNEHSQPLQASPRGYPSLYASRPTYEHMTSEVYQERSPMSKYGQLAQHPVFYYSQANGEVENRTQCKDSSSKRGEDVPLLHKHTISNPREHYVVPQWLHPEIPLSCTEMLPNHSFVQGFDYPCYTVPRFHLNASQIRPTLTRQHSSPVFHPTHINASKSSQHMNPSVTKDNTSLHFEQLHGSSPFRHVEKNNPARHLNQPALSPSSMQIGRFFHPLTSLHIDQPAPPPAGMNMDRLRDYSACEAKAKHPKSLPVSPAAWQPQSPSHKSDRIHTVVPNGANVRKIIHSPGFTTESKHNAFVSNAGAAVSKRCVKRGISHSSPPIRIKEEDEDLYEVELANKLQKLDKDNAKEGTKNNSPPMPVIDNVFSLAPCQLHLQASGVLYPSKLPQRAIQTSEKHEDKLKQAIKEKMPDPNNQQPVVCVASKEISAPKKDAEVFELKNIKVEKVDPSAEDDSVDAKNNCSKVIIKKEPEETGSSNSGPVLKEKCESDQLENKPSLAEENETSEESKPAEITAQINSSYQVDTPLKQVVALQPRCNTPLQSSESKVNFKNIPPHCLKLSTYNIIIPDGKQCKAAPPPQKQSPQPVTVLASRLEPQTPVRKHFLELHHSLCKLVSTCVSASPEQELKNWFSQLEISEPTPQSNKVQKVSCLLGVKAREEWINEEMKSALGNVHKRLREYTTQERCPFPHVMRTGAVFLPMLVVKELLFPTVHGSFIDQVLQEHKVELRPTTLSEEKILIQLHKRACSSRLRRLMSLKHLPDIYCDVVNLLYYTCVCKHLGLNVDPVSRDQDGGYEVSNSRRNPVFSDVASPASPSESHHQKDQEAQSDLSRRGTKSTVKSSLRHTFPDDTCSDEEEPGDVEKIGIEGVPSTFTRRNCDAYRSENNGTEHLVASQITISENSWMCPLTSDELSPSLSNTETEKSSNLLSCNQSTGPQVKSRNCSGMILKLRKMFGKGLNRKKTCYQAVSMLGTFADSSLSKADDGEGVSSKRDLHRTSKVKHRLQRKGSFSRALAPLNSSSKKKVRSLLKIKYCPYLSACHSAEHRKRWVLRSAVQRARRAMRLYYPDLVGKKIRHLYEEDDKSEVWYRGEVLRIHEAHTNPLKTIFEVRYDSEPEWKYYLELLIDYKKGWLKIED